MIHETENLCLNSDGDVYLVYLDEDGERDIKRLGHVDDCGYRVPDELEDEYLEMIEQWEQVGRDRDGYEAGIEMAWNRAIGW